MLVPESREINNGRMKLYSRQKQQQQQQPRRLERRNANKNIDYDASLSPSSSFDDQFDNHRLDILSDISSFRIEGTEGEFDVICKRLGLSGPDDFAISTADWENRRSYSPSTSRFNHSDPNLPATFQTQITFSDDQLKTDAQPRVLVDDNSLFVGDGIQSSEITSNGASVLATDDDDDRRLVGDGTECSEITSNGARVLEDGGEETRHGSGIKGLRPPSLAPPPAAMSRLLLLDDDNMASNWDLIRSFAPPDDDDDDNAIVSPSTSAEQGIAAVEVQYPLSTIKNWQKGDFLGSGSFGTVYEAFDELGHFFAVKEVSLLDQGSQGKQSIIQLEQEISLLSQFRHENIVQYLGTDKDDSKLYIFLELVTKGSLAKLYQKYELRDSQVSAYTRQILSGLNYLHERKVVHRDIKCANILVDASGSVKLADFGLAKATTLNDIKSCKGTPYWMAPEVVRSNSGYGLAADIWSLGCTVLEMLTRKVPYSHLEGLQALFRIGRGEPPPIPDTLSTEAQDFILECLQVNPNDRPTAAQLLDHQFLRRRTSMNFAPASPHYNATHL